MFLSGYLSKSWKGSSLLNWSLCGIVVGWLVGWNRFLWYIQYIHWGGLTPLQRCSLCILQPQLTGLTAFFRCIIQSNLIYTPFQQYNVICFFVFSYPPVIFLFGLHTGEDYRRTFNARSRHLRLVKIGMIQRKLAKLLYKDVLLICEVLHIFLWSKTINKTKVSEVKFIYQFLSCTQTLPLKTKTFT